jgi:AcrR family transcriptional regulator
MSKSASNLIWERPERQPRPVPVPLSRENVVRTAIALADAEGLSSVTLRKVGGALGAGPMRLYGYISTKEELLALMVDAIYAEMLAGEDMTAGSWRIQIARLADTLRAAALRHPWFAGLLAADRIRGRMHWPLWKPC